MTRDGIARRAVGLTPGDRSAPPLAPQTMINFHDEQGLRWTVTTPGELGPDGPSCMTLVFTSQSGERRTSEAWLPEGATWDGVEERTWCAFLRYSDGEAVHT